MRIYFSGFLLGLVHFILARRILGGVYRDDLFSVLSGDDRKKKLYWQTSLLALVGLGLMYSLLAISQSDIFHKGITTAQWRLDVWVDTLRMIKDRPFFGHGINTYMQLFQEYKINVSHFSGHNYAHNSFLQLAAETGLIGLTLFLFILFRALRNAQHTIAVFIRRCEINKGLLMLGLVCGILAFLTHSLMDNHLYSLQLSIFFWSVMGIIFSIIELECPRKIA